MQSRRAIEANVSRHVNMSFELHHGDCLEIMPRLVERFGGIITDIPYGTTACKWDTIIPLVPMWEQVKRLLKPNGAFITTASQPFTSVLVMSNLEWFKYCAYWKKSKASNFVHAPNMLLKTIEDVLVFSNGSICHQPNTNRMIFNPQGTVPGSTLVKQNPNTSEHKLHRESQSQHTTGYTCKNENYPTALLEFGSDNGLHPTQKPVALYEYLIRTYSNPGDTILDFAMGSGTTGVAAIRTGRHFVGIEKEREYYEIAEQRIRNAQPALFVEDKSLLTPRETDLLRSGAAGAKSQLSMFAGDGSE